MFDLAKKDVDYSSRSVKFWDEVEKKNIIPDRTSQSLRTAWRKFSKYGEEQFIKEALKDPKIRFSHQFERQPFIYSQQKPKYLSATESVVNSHREEDQPLDMEVVSHEGSEEPEEEEDEDMEFLLAVDDLQSAIAFNATDNRTYSLRPQKPVNKGRLNTMFDSRDDKLRNEERKRISVNLDTPEKEKTEEQQKELVKKLTFVRDEDFMTADSTNIYNQEDLTNFLSNDLKITVERDSKNNLSVKSKVVQSSNDQYFAGLNKELRALAREYDKAMDEIHMLFMEVCCDLGELRTLLKFGKGSKWTMLEDLAIQKEPNSMEFQHICDSKGESQVSKRKKFLEFNL